MAFANDPNTPPKQHAWEARLSEAAARIEAEVRAAVKTIDDEVIPEVRKHGSNGLRALAAKLDRLAQTMDDAHRESPPRSDNKTENKSDKS